MAKDVNANSRDEAEISHAINRKIHGHFVVAFHVGVESALKKVDGNRTKRDVAAIAPVLRALSTPI